jgi:chromosome segregation ATPase
MEDKTSPETTPPPAARTAQALRELHDRAQSALAAQRERMSRLEVQLTQQLDTIANTVAEQISAHGGSSDPTQLASPDIEQLRQEWNAAQTTWQAERDGFVAQIAEQSQLLDRKQAELDAAAAQVAGGHTDFDSRQQALDDRAAELNHRERDLRQQQELLDAASEQFAAQQSQLSASESALDKQRGEVAEREAAIQSSQAELDGARNDLDARESSWREGQSELASQQESLRAERDSLEAGRASLEAQRASLNEQLQTQADANQSDNQELAAQLAGTEKQLADERATWERERGNIEELRRLLAKERDELATALDAARNELTAARAQAGAAAERDELRQKFELALHDVQRLRGRVAELEQELDSRPEPDQSESVELVHLRAERDAMAERISELEQRPATPDDGDAEQERADLQRRFELAVEDVRELKKKNAQLESQLSAASPGMADAPASGGGGGSWEAMKKQMLANLEGEGDDVDEDRSEERATIESTIRITDEALARKDQEIADLQSQLADVGPKAPDESEAIRQLVDTDAVIAEHRARTAQLEEEMQEKLRAAELEISVERAKIARETAHLEELQAQIDAHRANGETPAAPGTAQQPKRRWLSKLGLGADEET